MAETRPGGSAIFDAAPASEVIRAEAARVQQARRLCWFDRKRGCHECRLSSAVPQDGTLTEIRKGRSIASHEGRGGVYAAAMGVGRVSLCAGRMGLRRGD